MSNCYNEEKIMPFYLDYYLNFIKADKIVIYDGGSTDNTPNIVKNYPNIEFIVEDKGKMDERNLKDNRNEGWKKYRYDYDWIIVCDMDEFIYHPNLRNLLHKYDLEGITVPLISGYDMVSNDFPDFKKGKYLPSFIQNGVHEPIWLNKSAVFKPGVVNINYDFGTHSCSPTGNVKYSVESNIKLLQYKWLSHEYVTNKSLESSLRLSDWNLETGMASHYKAYAKTTKEDFDKKSAAAVRVVDDFPEKDINVFWHCYLINNWEEIFEEQIDLLIKSELYDNLKSSSIHLFYYGDNDQIDKLFYLVNKHDKKNKISLHHIKNNFFEFPTIQSLYNFAQENDSYILYFHFKGVWSTLDSGKNADAIKSWRKCLEYFTIEKWHNCLKKLDEGYEVVGALYNYNKIHPLFSGNFWWSKSEYIKKLKYPNYDPSMNPYLGTPEDDGTWTRVECEKWINTIPNNFYNFYVPKDYGFYYVPIQKEDYVEKIVEELNKNEIAEKPIVIFHHNFLFGNWKNIITEQFDLMKTSGLYEACKEIHTSVYNYSKNNTDFESFIHRLDPMNKTIIHWNSENEYEFGCLKIIKNYCDGNSANICYFHTKGVYSETVPANVGVKTWRDFLNYFTITRWKDNIEKLKDYDIVGVNYDYNDMHKDYVIGGNFFWTKSDYVKTLPFPEKESNRFNAERWILTNNDRKVFELFNSGKLGYKNLYMEIITPSEYQKEEIVNKRKEELLKKRRMYFDTENDWNMLEGLKDLIEETITKDSVVCEVGSFEGVSSEMFALHCKELYCVDIWDEYWSQVIRDSLEKFLNNISPSLYKKPENKSINEVEKKFDDMNKNYPNIKKIKNFSTEASRDFPDEFFDVVYIDASHNYESVKQDISYWLPKIKKDGYVSGHDYYDKPSDDVYLEFGVKKAVDEIFPPSIVKVYKDSSWRVKLSDIKEKEFEVNERGVIINRRGYWMNNILMEESFDGKLFEEFKTIFKDKMVLDLGCGHGYYTKRLMDSGIYCEGYDGNPNTEKLTNGICKVQDLTTDFNLTKKFDWVLCLEVGEHIPSEYEETFINNIDRNCKEGVILSWAVIGQGGDGHVNCKSNEDVKKIFEKRGYYNDIELENQLREESEINWFKNTLMVFRKCKISVIIPTHDRKELNECIDSVLRQDYENIEILVCHDGPSAEYDKYKDLYTDKRIKFYNTYHQRNNLGAAQRNMMLEKVNGNWVLFLDDDNILFDGYLKRMIREMDDETAMVVCRIYFNDKEWNNLILPLEDKLIPTQIDHLSILFRADIAKKLMWDNDWGQDHRYINACESIIKSKGLKIKYIPDVLADHRYLKPKDYSDELVIIYDNGNIDSFISKMKNYNRKILLTSNNSASIGIQRNVDYFFLSNNKIILDNFYSCMNFGKDLGFKRFICVSSDNEVNFMDIDNKMSDIKIRGNKFHHFNDNFFLFLS